MKRTATAKLKKASGEDLKRVQPKTDEKKKQK